MWSVLFFYMLLSNTEASYYRILATGPSYLLIGGKNALYNMSTFPHFKQNWRLDIGPASGDWCVSHGNSYEDCQSYPKVVFHNGANLVVCGPDSFEALCYEFEPSSDGMTPPEEISSWFTENICSNDPHDTSTFLEFKDKLYVGFTKDSYPRISRFPIRTYPNNRALNRPEFLGAFPLTTRVAFIFRELEEERPFTRFNDYTRFYGGKQVSRVGSVCINDTGERHSRYNTTWTSFYKTTLECASLRINPSIFTVVQAYSMTRSLVYMVFRGQKNMRIGSVVCSYTLKQLEGAFNVVPCVSDSINYDAKRESTSEAPLLSKAIKATSLVFHTTGFEVNAIAVQLLETNRPVLYLGTDNGVILKVYEGGLMNRVSVTRSKPIQQLVFFQNRLIALSDDAMMAFEHEFTNFADPEEPTRSNFTINRRTTTSYTRYTPHYTTKTSYPSTTLPTTTLRRLTHPPRYTLQHTTKTRSPPTPLPSTTLRITKPYVHFTNSPRYTLQHTTKTSPSPTTLPPTTLRITKPYLHFTNPPRYTLHHTTKTSPSPTTLPTTTLKITKPPQSYNTTNKIVPYSPTSSLNSTQSTPILTKKLYHKNNHTNSSNITLAGMSGTSLDPMDILPDIILGVTVCFIFIVIFIHLVLLFKHKWYCGIVID